MNKPWIKLSKSNNDTIKMFCFPYSGSSAQAYMHFAEAHHLGVDVYALEMPGRGRRFQENMFDSISSIVDEATKALIPLLKARNFIFFGHSLGGLIAFEVARKLRRGELQLPMHMFVSGMMAPQIPRKEPPFSDLPENEFIEKLKQLEGTPDEVLKNPEMLELMVPILRKDFQIYEKYKYKSEDPLKCPITAFGSTTDKYIDPEDVQKWSEQTSILFSKHIFEGGHFFIYSHINDIVDIINRTLTMHRPW